MINLKERTDRWAKCIENLDVLEGPYQRVIAVAKDEVGSAFTSPAVAACWLSHKKALLSFISSPYAHALILEDDFKIDSKRINSILDLCVSQELDLVQIGFLYTTLKERIYIKMENFFDLFIRLYGIIEKRIFMRKPSQKNLVRERIGISLRCVPYDLRPGAHAYLINKKAASYLVALNLPIFLSTDDLLMSIAPMRFIRSARLRKSAISQSGSPSSIRPSLDF